MISGMYLIESRRNDKGNNWGEKTHTEQWYKKIREWNNWNI